MTVTDYLHKCATKRIFFQAFPATRIEIGKLSLFRSTNPIYSELYW